MILNLVDEVFRFGNLLRESSLFKNEFDIDYILCSYYLLLFISSFN